jgi:hypothetical protein
MGPSLDENYSIDDFAPEALESLLEDCADFVEAHADLIRGREGLAGHDFWLTRNGHGAGFWDGGWPESGDVLTKASEPYGSVDLYVGNDGKIRL